ncbi:hypothetical protein BWK57_13570 [Flavobacterium columnare]|uniref:DUF6876 family protein n=1 Tax=Flavobacterium columnare TaxID=996 RepID=UPI000CDB89DD|nr:DUF6876 family protein [Flavobacterium columnare]POR19419.1 hypothetical protein BWK57_13570 [Flavobacterium columnare]
MEKIINYKKTNDFYNSDNVTFTYKKSSLIFHYSNLVRRICIEKNAYWVIKEINSLQEKFSKVSFQVWKLKRNFKKNETGIISRLDSFSLILEDENNNILLEKKIEFSEYPDDELNLLLIDKILILPCEY